MAAGVLAIAALAAIVYWPVISRPTAFLWDDDRYVSANPLLLSLDGLPKIWFSTESPSQYFPLTYTSFWFEYRLWGLHAQGYHIVNVVLHVGNALLIWLLLSQLKIPGAWLAAAIFVVHPVNVESVAWITERKNVLSGVFFWGALLAWVSFVRFDRLKSKAGRVYALSFALFALALFAKTTACVLPAAMVLVLWIERKPITAKRWLQIAPFVVWGLVMGLLTVWWEHVHQRTGDDLLSYTWNVRPIVASRAFWFYVGKLVWPGTLSFSYPMWDVNPRSASQYVWLAGLVVFAIATTLLARTHRKFVAGVLFFAAASLPTLGLIPLYTFIYSYVADHYQYVACVGLIAIVSAGVAVVDRRLPHGRVIAGCIAVTMLTALAIRAERYAGVFESPGTLWANVLESNPQAWMAYNNLGLWREEKSDLAGARLAYEQSLTIRPDNAKAYLNLAVLSQKESKPADAIAQLERGIKFLPDNVELLMALANANADAGDYERAMAEYRRVLELEPNSLLAKFNLAALLGRTDDTGKAASLYLEILRADNRFTPAMDNLANLYARSGRHERAIELYERSLRLLPDRPIVLNSLAASLASTGPMDRAESAWRAATQIDPKYTDAYTNWGLALLQRQRTGEAKMRLQQALSIDPANAAAKSALDPLLHPTATTRGLLPQ